MLGKILALLTLIPLTPAARAAPPVMVVVAATKIYVPTGFDSNDEAQVVVEGKLPDTCYKVAHTDVKRSEDGRQLTLTQWARWVDGICVPMTVPYKSEVSLGRLPAGTYQLSSAGAAERRLEVVEAATTSQDDFIYAPVTKVKIGRDPEHGYRATLTGQLPNACFKVERHQILEQEDVLVVLPILSYQDGGSCGGPVDFTEAVRLPKDLPMGRYLVHVRSMNGQALNTVFFADGD